MTFRTSGPPNPIGPTCYALWPREPTRHCWPLLWLPSWSDTIWEILARGAMWYDPSDSRSAGVPPAGPLSGGQLAPIVGGHHNPLEANTTLTTNFQFHPISGSRDLNSGWHPSPVLALSAFSGAEMINLELCSWLRLSCRFGRSWPLTWAAARKEVEQKCLQWPGKQFATPCNTLNQLRIASSADEGWCTNM